MQQNAKKYKIGSTEHVKEFAERLHLKIKKPDDMEIPDIDYAYLIRSNTLWKTVLEIIYTENGANYLYNILREIQIEKARPAFTLYRMFKAKKKSKKENKEKANEDENRRMFGMENKKDSDMWNNYEGKDTKEMFDSMSRNERFHLVNVKAIIEEFLFLGYKGEVVKKREENVNHRVEMRIFRSFHHIMYYLQDLDPPSNFDTYTREFWKTCAKTDRKRYIASAKNCKILLKAGKDYKEYTAEDFYLNEMQNKDKITAWNFLDYKSKVKYIKWSFEYKKKNEILKNIKYLFERKNPVPITHEFKLFENDVKELYPPFESISSVIISDIYDKAPIELKQSYQDYFKIKKICEYYIGVENERQKKIEFNNENPRELAVNVKYKEVNQYKSPDKKVAKSFVKEKIKEMPRARKNKIKKKIKEENEKYKKLKEEFDNREYDLRKNKFSALNVYNKNEKEKLKKKFKESNYENYNQFIAECFGDLSPIEKKEYQIRADILNEDLLSKKHSLKEKKYYDKNEYSPYYKKANKKNIDKINVDHLLNIKKDLLEEIQDNNNSSVKQKANIKEYKMETIKEESESEKEDQNNYENNINFTFKKKEKFLCINDNNICDKDCEDNESIYDPMEEEENDECPKSNNNNDNSEINPSLKCDNNNNCDCDNEEDFENEEYEEDEEEEEEDDTSEDVKYSDDINEGENESKDNGDIADEDPELRKIKSSIKKRKKNIKNKKRNKKIIKDARTSRKTYPKSRRNKSNKTTRAKKIMERRRKGNKRNTVKNNTNSPKKIYDKMECDDCDNN
jgi:hypothetical protein